MILYFHTTSPSYIRCKKFISFFKENSYEFKFIGCERKGQVWADDNHAIKPNVKLGHGLKSLIPLLWYIVYSCYYVRVYNPKTIIITNEELFVIPLLANYKGTIILDAIDALDIRTHSKFKLMNFLLSRYVKFVRSRVNIIIEVEHFRSERFPQFQAKTKVIRNIPKNINFAHYNISHLPTEPYIFAWGSLNQGINGIEQLIDAVELFNATSNDVIRIKIAGIIQGAALSSKVLNSSVVDILGYLEYEQCMSLLEASICGFAFYKPVNDNFRLAAPNKVYEALSVGKYILINNECKIAKKCRELGFTGDVSYSDVVKLTEEIAIMYDRVKLNIDTLSPVKFNFHEEMEVLKKSL